MKKKPLQIGLAGVMLTATVLGTPAMAAQFTDVASNHWASASISKMVDKGVLKGVGNNKFDPAKEVTYAEFVTMMVRHFKGEQAKPGTGDQWYTPFWETAKTNGYLKGMETVDPNTAINRYDMALMLLNAQPLLSLPMDGEKPADWGVIPEKYKDAILACYDNQLLQGLDKKGTFGGTTCMNRAQAATILSRLVGDLQTEQTTPTTPTNHDKPPVVVTPPSSNIPAGATQFKDIDNDPLIDTSYYPWNLKNLGNGSFQCNANGLGASDSGIQFVTNGQYKTINCTFKNTSTKQTQYIRVVVPAAYNGGLDGRFVGDMLQVKPGETKTRTVDITGEVVVQLVVGDGSGSNGILSNVYLTK